MSESTENQLSLPRPQTEDLFVATEALRQTEFDSVPAELLEAVLRAEETHLDDRVGAARGVARAVETWLSETAPDEGDDEVTP